MHNENIKPDFWIDNIPVYGKLMLAPMDGFSDMPFRSLVRELGSAVSYTEFINIQDVLSRKMSLEYQLRFLEEERPVIYQVYDDDPDRIVKGVQILMERKPDAIDINLGCSAKAVAGRGAGAGLLREPEKIGVIFRALSRVLPVPVTGKIRLGWDQHSKNYLEVAKIIEDNGGKMLAVHARTRSQDYRQKADWEAIAEIKRAVSIPVIGNGDIWYPADIKRMLDDTGCDGVMIGRAAIDNPWIFKYWERNQVPRPEENRFIFAHLDRMLAFYGEVNGLRRFRKFIKSYLRPYPIPPEGLRRLLTCENVRELKEQITGYLDLGSQYWKNS